MSLYVDIKNQIKDAMRAKDAIRLNALRNLSAALQAELVNKGTADTELKDEDSLAIIRRLVKQRKDSIEQFTKGGRPELAQDEQSELSILETYLPKMMSREDIKKIAEQKKTQMGTVDKSKTGMLMAAIMKELKGKADGADVKAVVESLFL
ncbi:MAG: GatB/YqeY domain-containing protein [Candidatus Taylorbacteria bacterium]|nr:GatB/YqeY domain-containing protein [Candidatus Taylorbacteria bacterium]